MFIGSTIVKRRKEKGVTQTELANGICTQNTISKIEKHNIPPTTKILIRLCLRLDLSLNDVFSEFTKTNIPDYSEMDQIEKDLYYGNNKLSDKKVKKITKNNTNKKTEAQAEFILAFFKFSKGEYNECSFNCDKILMATHNNINDIYTLLAYTLKGMVYKTRHQNDEANYLFKIIAEQFKNGYKGIKANNIQLAFICNQLSQFWLEIGKYRCAMNVIDFILKLNQKNSTTYFLDNVFKVGAKVGQNLKWDKEKVNQFKTFSKLFDEYHNFIIK